MDRLNGNFGASEEVDFDDTYDLGEEEIERQDPPPGIGQDERRMQVRAYNHWAGLLRDRNFPSIEELDPTDLPDFGPHSVLLDFTKGIDDPAVPYLGPKLAVECGADEGIEQLSDVPSRSLLSRITDHYMQILANQAPIGFEAEFVNQRSATILYRGILLPFSSDDETIDFIYGVINWKEMADQMTTDELLLEIDQALDEDSPLANLDVEDADDSVDDDEVALEDEVEAPRNPLGEAMDDWADGPGNLGGGALQDIVPGPSFGSDYDDEEEEEGEEESTDFPSPAFGSLTGAMAQPKREPIDLSGVSPIDPDGDFENEDPAMDSGFGHAMPQEYVAPLADQFDAVEEPATLETDFPEPDLTLADTADAGLHDCLAAARESAQAARSCEDRSRSALYEAVGRAYDVSLAAADEPQEFSQLVEESGLSVQERAPMTPVVKLVFGADYDKTRLTEYAAVLGHAHRLGVERGELSGFLKSADGGLKGVVSAERRMRREESGKAVDPVDTPRASIVRKLRAIEPRSVDDIAPEGPEFALVMVRRMPDGSIALLGELEEDIPLVERAARKLLS